MEDKAKDEALFKGQVQGHEGKRWVWFPTYVDRLQIPQALRRLLHVHVALGSRSFAVEEVAV